MVFWSPIRVLCYYPLEGSVPLLLLLIFFCFSDFLEKSTYIYKGYNRYEFLVVNMNFFVYEFLKFFHFLCWFIVNFLCFMLYFFLVLWLLYVFEFCSTYFWKFFLFCSMIFSDEFWPFFEKICLYQNSILEMCYDRSEWFFEARSVFYAIILWKDRFLCCSC